MFRNKNYKKRSTNFQSLEKTKWTDVNMKIDSFEINGSIASINKFGNSLYLRWGEGPNNALLINTGKIDDNNKCKYSVNTILYTNTNWSCVQCLNQILNYRDNLCELRNPISIYLHPKKKILIENILEGFYDCNISQKKYKLSNIKEIDLENHIILGDDNNIRVSTFQTYYDINSIGYLIEYLDKNSQWKEIVAFTGETTIDVFKNHDNKFLLRVPYLFTDITYIDKKTSIYEASVKGHIHLHELKNFNFTNSKIIGFNISSNYTRKYIESIFSDSKYNNFKIISKYNF